MAINLYESRKVTTVVGASVFKHAAAVIRANTSQVTDGCKYRSVNARKEIKHFFMMVNVISLDWWQVMHKLGVHRTVSNPLCFDGGVSRQMLFTISM